MTLPPKELSRTECRLLGLQVTPVDLEGLLSYVSAALADSAPRLIAGHNLHSAYILHTDLEFHRFYQIADVILADGAPVLWDYRFSKGSLPNQRLGSTDWLPHLDRVSGLNRISVIGAQPESNRLFISWLNRLLPDVAVQGIPGDSWDKAKADLAASSIEEFAPQLILIGIGMPRQEMFAKRLVMNGCTAVIATIGGAIDQLAGVQKNAPRWTGRLGVEWLWRLLTQPRRLWKRYLVEPWKLLWVRVAGSF